MPAATAAPAGPAPGISTGKGVDQNQGVPTSQPDNPLAASLDSTLIVKTGQLSLEVTDLDKAVTQAQRRSSAWAARSASSKPSGTGDDAVASVTYRVPVARWDDALTALRKLGSKTLSEQTGTSDVTSQVVDLNARLDNLKTTESALQAIMARASGHPGRDRRREPAQPDAGPDRTAHGPARPSREPGGHEHAHGHVPAAGQDRDDQATQDWTLGSQVDEAAAALVRIGQGLATMGVWALVVVLPIGFAALLLLAILALARRLLARRRRDSAATTA